MNRRPRFPRAARLRPAIRLLAVLLAASVPGCSGPVGADRQAGEADGAGSLGPFAFAPPGTEPQEATDGPPSPAWPEGAWIRYEVEAPTKWSGSLTAVMAGGMFVADSRRWAIEEATLDLPMLGPRDASTGATTAFGGDWPLPRLPLEDGGSWTATLHVFDDYGAPLAQPVVITARGATVFTPRGQEAGFEVTARDGDRVVVETSFAPSLRLPTFTRLYAPSGNLTWGAVAVGLGTGWTGERWTATATGLVDGYALVAPDPTLIGPPTARPSFQAEAELPSASGAVFGYLLAVAVGGAADALLLAPDGTRQEATAVGAPFRFQVVVVDVPAQAGTWRAAASAAAAVAFAGAFLWHVEVRPLPGAGPSS